MAYGKAEQIEGPKMPWHKPWRVKSRSAYSKLMKSTVNRGIRRAFKVQGEDAPVERKAFTRGWEW